MNKYILKFSMKATPWEGSDKQPRCHNFSHLSFVGMAGSSDSTSWFLFLATAKSLCSVVSTSALRLWAPTSGQVCVWSFTIGCRLDRVCVPVGRWRSLLRGLGQPYNGALGTGFLRLLLASCDCDRLAGGGGWAISSSNFHSYRVRSGLVTRWFVFQAAFDTPLSFATTAPGLTLSRWGGRLGLELWLRGQFGFLRWLRGNRLHLQLLVIFGLCGHWLLLLLVWLKQSIQKQNHFII